MGPVRGAIGGGVVATVALTFFLLATGEVVAGTDLFRFGTFAGLCAFGGPPFCEPGTNSAMLLNYAVFATLFSLGWPLFFVGFTWALPGRAGAGHGLVFGLVLWSGYAVGVFTGIGGEEILTVFDPAPLSLSVLAFLVYGFVLGTVYDLLASHRTLLGGQTEGA